MKHVMRFFFLVGFSTALLGQTISNGAFNSYILCDNGIPMACGANNNGQLGLGYSDNNDHYTFTSYENLSGITAISGGHTSVFFLKNDGTVWGTGSNQDGRLGLDISVFSINEPIQIPGLTDIVAISTGVANSFFLKNDGTVWGCGKNFDGEIGLGHTNPQYGVIQMPGLSDVIAIANGTYHSMFLKNDGTVWATGANGAGQLGINSNLGRATTPVQVLISNVTAIATGYHHSIFLKDDGNVWVCGTNMHGELGNGGATPNSRSPIQVNSVSDIVSIHTSGTSYNSMFLKNDGTVWQCGGNELGNFGSGATVGSNIVVMNPLINAINDLTTNGYHTVFLKNDGTLWSAGGNISGQLGVYTASSAFTPIQIPIACAVLDNENQDLAEENLFLYPNPSQGIVHLSKKLSQSCDFVLYSALGQELFNEILNLDTEEIDLSKNASGIYYYTLEFENGHKTNGKIIIE